MEKIVRQSEYLRRPHWAWMIIPTIMTGILGPLTSTRNCAHEGIFTFLLYTAGREIYESVVVHPKANIVKCSTKIQYVGKM